MLRAPASQQHDVTDHFIPGEHLSMYVHVDWSPQQCSNFVAEVMFGDHLMVTERLKLSNFFGKANVLAVEHDAMIIEET